MNYLNKHKVKSIVLTLLVTFCSCKEKKYTPEGLVKLSNEELIERAENYIPTWKDKTKVVFKNEKGIVIPHDSIDRISNWDNWATDKYVDKNGDVQVLILRKATPEDLELRKAVIDAYKRAENITPKDIDCSKKKKILEEVYRLDQEMRKGKKKIDMITDLQNLTKVVSIIEKCGMPTKEEVGQKLMHAVWVIIQHGKVEVQKRYLPQLEEAAKRGDIKATSVAMLKDRILVTEGKPQIYGTQVRKNNKTGKWELDEIENPETVNKRRDSIGFMPIQDYLNKWNIKFEVKQTQ